MGVCGMTVNKCVIDLQQGLGHALRKHALPAGQVDGDGLFLDLSRKPDVQCQRCEVEQQEQRDGSGSDTRGAAYFRDHGMRPQSVCFSKRPKCSMMVGRISRFSMVEVTKPPTMMVAIGPSISRPGCPLPAASGNSPNAVTSAVIRMDGSRSEAPRIAVSRFQVMFSSSIRCW